MKQIDWEITFSKRLILLIITVITVLQPLKVKAVEETTYIPDHTNYQVLDSDNFSIGSDASVDKFSYGDDAIGTLSITGTINKVSPFNGVTAYSTEQDLHIKYKYDPRKYQNDKPDEWKLISSSEKKIGNISLNKFKMGAIVIQKSKDGKAWENLTKPSYDCFASGTAPLDVKLTKKEIGSGVGIRVIVVYEMEKTISSSQILFITTEEKTNIKCVEI